MKRQRNQGFLVLEILIAGLILTASIAVTMHLFNVGYGYLEKTRQINVLSSKLIQAAGLFKTLDLNRQSGKEDMGDGVTIVWSARLVNSSVPMIGEGEFTVKSNYELLLYHVDFTAQYQGITKDYQLNVFKYRTISTSGNKAL